VLGGARAASKPASRVLRLSAGDWRLLAEAIVVMPYIEVALRVMPLDRLLATLGREARVREQDLNLERTARLVDVLLRRYPFHPSCLKKSLVLFALARRRGLPAQLRIGVRKDRGELLAHAWIECAGRTLIPGDGVERYHPLPPITARVLAAARAGRYSW
jgi:Transglutaminase-like superfamily